MYDEDLEQDDTVDCPFCGEPMYDDADRCPSCGHYVSSADFAKRIPTWVVIVIVLTILTFLMPYLATVWNMLRP